MIKHLTKRKTPLAWRQLIKAKGRFLVAVSGIAFADILILMQLGFQTALFDSNTRVHNLLKTDLVLINPKAQNLGLINTFPRRRLFQAANLPEVASASPLYVRLGNWKNPESKIESPIIVIGFNPKSNPFNLPEIQQNLNSIRYPDKLLFDSFASPKYQATIAKVSQGQPVSTQLQGRTVTITGLYKIGVSFTAEASVITSDQNFLRIFSQQAAGQVNVGLINLKPGNNANLVAAKLRSQLPDDVKVLTRQEFIDFERKYWETGTTIGFIFGLGVVMGFLVGLIIVYQILYSDVSDHLAEYATLKAMGYSNFYLLSVIFQEAGILAIIGYTPGFLISTGLYILISNATKLPLIMTGGVAINILILTIIMCTISGVIAMQKLRSADPADIF